MANLAVFIKTCPGRPSLLWVIESIQKNLLKENYRIYISDENPVDTWKKDLYEKLESQGHYIEINEQGISCGKARNNLVRELEDEKFVLRLDDDFELGGEFNIESFKTVLNSSEEIGFCSDLELQLGNNKGVFSGSFRPSGGEFLISEPNLIKKYHGPFKSYKKEAGIRYRLAEHTRNLLLIKRDVLEKVKWNEQLLFRGEHEEFMLSVKEAGFKGAYTPDSIHYHRDDLAVFRSKNGGSVQVERPGNKELKKVLQNRWGCEKITTKYPFSWYVIEGIRRIISKVIS